MGKRGGARPGAGRKKGVLGKQNAEFRAYIRERIIAEKGELITAQLLKAKGSEGIPPDSQAFKVLVEHGFGKPLESVDVTSQGKRIVSFNYLEPNGGSDDHPETNAQAA